MKSIEKRERSFLYGVTFQMSGLLINICRPSGWFYSHLGYLRVSYIYIVPPFLSLSIFGPPVAPGSRLNPILRDRQTFQMNRLCTATRDNGDLHPTGNELFNGRRTAASSHTRNWNDWITCAGQVSIVLARCVYFVEISRAVLVIEGKRLAFKHRRCSTRLKFEKRFALI